MSNPYFPSHEFDSMAGRGAGPGWAMANPGYDALGRCPPGGTEGTGDCPPALWGPCGPPAGGQALAAAAAAGLARAGLYQQSSLSAAAKVELARGDDLMYGLDSGAVNIAAAATATITVTPQKRHVPQRIVLSANVANNFIVTDIRTGVEPILATVGAISAAVFIQDATTPPFRSVVSEVGMDFSITVTNITGAAQRFTATVLGKYLPYGL